MRRVLIGQDERGRGAQHGRGERDALRDAAQSHRALQRRAAEDVARARQLGAGQLLHDVVDDLVPHALRHLLVGGRGRFGVGEHAVRTPQEAQHVRWQA